MTEYHHDGGHSTLGLPTDWPTWSQGRSTAPLSSVGVPNAFRETSEIGIETGFPSESQNTHRQRGTQRAAININLNLPPCSHSSPLKVVAPPPPPPCCLYHIMRGGKGRCRVVAGGSKQKKGTTRRRPLQHRGQTSTSFQSSDSPTSCETTSTASKASTPTQRRKGSQIVIKPPPEDTEYSLMHHHPSALTPSMTTMHDDDRHKQRYRAYQHYAAGPPPSYPKETLPAPRRSGGIQGIDARAPPSAPQSLPTTSLSYAATKPWTPAATSSLQRPQEFVDYERPEPWQGYEHDDVRTKKRGSTDGYWDAFSTQQQQQQRLMERQERLEALARAKIAEHETIIQELRRQAAKLAKAGYDAGTAQPLVTPSRRRANDAPTSPQYTYTTSETRRHPRGGHRMPFQALSPPSPARREGNRQAQQRTACVLGASPAEADALLKDKCCVCGWLCSCPPMQP